MYFLSRYKGQIKSISINILNKFISHTLAYHMHLLQKSILQAFNIQQISSLQQNTESSKFQRTQLKIVKVHLLSKLWLLNIKIIWLKITPKFQGIQSHFLNL